MHVSPVSELVARPTILSGPLRLAALMLTSKDPLGATVVRVPWKSRTPLSGDPHLQLLTIDVAVDFELDLETAVAGLGLELPVAAAAARALW